MSISKERKDREEKAVQYGSWENYQAKMDLLADEEEVGKAYREQSAASHGRHQFTDEEKLIESLGVLPLWMDSFRLAGLPLALLGAPEGSEEYQTIASGKSLRVNRLRPNTWEEPRDAVTKDYTQEGWPVSDGKAWRYVTPEEHLEIMGRLGKSSLTKPGSSVQLRKKTLREMLEEDIQPADWLIEGIIRKGGAAMVYGPSGVGKTWLVHTLMLLAAAGNGVAVEGMVGPVLKAGEHRRANVYLLDGEMTEADVTQRVKILMGGLGIQTDAVGDVQAYLKTFQDYRASWPDLVDPEWTRRIIQYCMKEKIELLVLDNLSTLTATLEDENAAADWHPLNALVVSLKEAGVACLLVHHSNKAGTGYRGSSSLSTTLETIVRLERLQGPQAKAGAAFQVSIEKDRANGRPPIDGKTMVLKPEGRWAVEIDDFTKASEAVEMLRSRRYCTQTELGDELGINRMAVSRLLTTAKGLRLIDEMELRKVFTEAKELRRERSAGVFQQFDEPDAEVAAAVEALGI